MISYAVYKTVHYLGIFALVAGLSATLGRAAVTRSGESVEEAAGDPWRRRLAVSHGIALLLILLGGFGMLARIGVEHGELFPGWVWVKLALWVVLGGLIAARRSGSWAGRALVLVPLLAALAGYVAYTKPF